MATLTTVQGVNNALRTANPASMLRAQENLGNVRVLYDYYTVASADEFGTSGLVRLMLIPKNATLINAYLVMQAAGATGIFDVGWAASAELSAGTAVEAADADGIFVDADPGAAAVASWMNGTTPGYMKRFTAEVEVQADWEEASADSGDDVLELTLLISIN